MRRAPSLLLAGALLSASVPAVGFSAGAVAIGEVSCERDWVEIVNTGTSTTPLVGLQLADERTPPSRASVHRFSRTATLAPRGRLVVRDLPFGIGCGSDTIYLLRSNDSVLDRVTVPNLVAGYTWSRRDEAWGATRPTPGRVNASPVERFVADRAAPLFDPQREWRIDLTMDRTQMQLLADNPKQYVPAEMRATTPAGLMIPTGAAMQIGVREKGGFGSRLKPEYGAGGLDIVEDKVGLKLKFNYSVKGQTFLGLKKLTLNNMVQDATMTRETVQYELFRAYGIPAPRTGYANVYINGELRGLYLLVEPYDEISLAWWMPDLQHLYEGEVVANNPEDAPADVTSQQVPRFAMDEGDENDRSDIVALAASLETAAGFSDRARERIDVDALARYLALQKYSNQWDGYATTLLPWPKNYFLASNSRGRFIMLPWGADEAWIGRWTGDTTPEDVEVFDRGNAILFWRCVLDDYCASAYRRTLADLAVRTADLGATVRKLMEVHAKSRLADPLRYRQEWHSEWELGRMEAFIKRRPAEAQAYLRTVVTGVIRWSPEARTIPYGTAVDARHLNAYTDAYGRLTYSVKAGTVLKRGQQRISVTFTPADPSVAGVTMTQTFTVK